MPSALLIENHYSRWWLKASSRFLEGRDHAASAYHLILLVVFGRVPDTWQMHSKYLLDESLNLPFRVCICTCFEWFGLNCWLCTLMPLSVSLGRDSHLGLFLISLHLSALSCGLSHLFVSSWHLPSSQESTPCLSTLISWSRYLLMPFAYGLSLIISLFSSGCEIWKCSSSWSCAMHTSDVCLLN